MPRKTIKKFIPDAEQIRQYPALSWLHGGFVDPQIWHLNRHSVAGAVAVGLFIGWQPVPLQMVLAALVAMMLHVNLPISVLLVWISNPFTFPALLYAAYRTGTILTGRTPAAFRFQPTTEWLLSWLNETWLPVMLGCLFLGALSAVVGFCLVRLLWRLTLVRRWQDRRNRKAAAS